MNTPYCRNCGRLLAFQATICASCGVPAPVGDKFCQKCGSATDSLAVVCVNCGSGLVTSEAGIKGSKSKTVAVLLAVFLSFWTWLYTYKRNARKFWVGVGTVVFWFGLAFWAASGLTPEAIAYLEGTAPAGTPVPPQIDNLFRLWYVGFAISFATWLWALLDTVLRKDSWYKSY